MLPSILTLALLHVSHWTLVKLQPLKSGDHMILTLYSQSIVYYLTRDRHSINAREIHGAFVTDYLRMHGTFLGFLRGLKVGRL